MLCVCVYIGKKDGDFSTLLNYFSRELGKEADPKQNPADFILEAVGAGIPKIQKEEEEEEDGEDEIEDEEYGQNKEKISQSEEENDHVVVAYKNSKLYANTKKILEQEKLAIAEEAQQRKKKTGLTHLAKKRVKKMFGRYSTSFWTQLRHVLTRNLMAYWRDPVQFKARLLM